MIFDVALGIFLFLSPIVVMLGQNAKINGTVTALQFYQFRTLSFNSNVLQYQFFEYGILALLIIALTQNPIRNFKDKCIAWFLGLCAVSIVLHPKTISAFAPILLGISLYYLIVTYTEKVKALFYIIFLVSLLNTIFAILQFFNIYWLYKPTGSIFGLMCLSSHLGAYQAIVFPICYAVNPFLSLIPLVGLLLAKSTTPFIALLVGMVYLWFPKKERIFVNLAPMGWTVLLGIFVVFFIRNYQNIIYKFILRLELWVNVLKEIFKNPLGIGLGVFSTSKLAQLFAGKYGRYDWVYNEYLEIALCIGIASWFIAGLFLTNRFQGIGTGIERAVASSCLIIVIICLGQPILHFPRLAGTIIPIFAFLEILKRKEIKIEN